MERKTDLSRTLVNSYRVALYRVMIGNGKSFVLKIKKKSADLEALMKSHNLFTAVYVNPTLTLSRKRICRAMSAGPVCPFGKVLVKTPRADGKANPVF